MNILPLIEILVANIIWGFGFVATIWAYASFSWEQIFFWRFLLAGLSGLLIYLFFSRKNLKTYLLASFIPSLFLSLEIFCQIFSLQSTKATEGGFLFVTYIFMIPSIEYMIFKKKISPAHFLWIFLGAFGSFLMLNQEGIKIGLGEFAMLASAFFASAHVIAIDRLKKLSLNAFFLNTFQLVWGLILSAPLLFSIGMKSEKSVTPIAIAGLLSIAFGSTLIAYFLQIKSQEKISPALISILFLVESIFSAIFAFFLLDEKMTNLQWLGAVVISISAVAVSLSFLKSEKVVA